MNSHSCDLLLPIDSRSNGLKSGTGGICFAHRIYPGIARHTEFKGPDPRGEPFNQPLWHGRSVRARVVPSKTASPEMSVFRYFPL